MILLKEKFCFLAFIVTYEKNLNKINIGNLNYESRILEKNGPFALFYSQYIHRELNQMVLQFFDEEIVLI